MPEQSPAAFVSYSRVDSEFVMRLTGDLKAAGANVWLDQLDIPPGERWDRAVEGALVGSPLLLVVLSSAAIDSMNVMDEVAFALEKRKTVIPILIQDCAIPFRLRRIQHIDFRRDYSRGLTALLKHLGVHAPEPTIIQASEASSGTTVDTRAEQERLEREQDAERRANQEETSRMAEAESQWQEAAERAAREQLEAQQKVEAERAAERIEREREETRLKAEEAGQYWPQAARAAPEQSRLRAMFKSPLFRSFLSKAGIAAGVVLVGVLLYFGWVHIEQVRNAANAQKACDGGDLEACMNLASLYSEGSGVSKDESTAASLYQKVCDGGKPDGCLYAGVDYYQGDGVSKDATRADGLFQKACDGGESMGCVDIAEGYENGDGVVQDINQAKKLYQEACIMGSDEGCYEVKQPKFQ